MMPKKISSREQTGMVLLGAALLVFLYFNVVYRPAERKIHDFHQEVIKMEKQMKNLRQKDPIVQEQQGRILAAQKQVEVLRQQIEGFEKDIPAAIDAQVMIQEISKMVPPSKLASIRQKTVLEDPYQRIFFEMMLRGTFPEILDVLWKIESISPQIQVESIDIQEDKSGKAEETALGMPVKLVVSSLLKQNGVGGGFKALTPKPGAFEASKRDILVPEGGSGRKVPKKKINLKVEGITYNGDDSVAIINGNVYQEGGEVEGMMIKEILQNEVILADDISEYHLRISQGDEGSGDGSGSSSRQSS